MLRSLDRALGWLVAVTAVLGTLGLLVEVAVILTDVGGRFFGAPLRGAHDIVTMAMIVLVFGGMAACDREGGHISVDVFQSWFSPGMNRAIDVVSALLGATIFLGLAWTMWESAAISRLLNSATNILDLPKAWFQYYIIAISLVTAAGMLVRVGLIVTGQRAALPGPVAP